MTIDENLERISKLDKDIRLRELLKLKYTTFTEIIQTYNETEYREGLTKLNLALFLVNNSDLLLEALDGK